MKRKFTFFIFVILLVLISLIINTHANNNQKKLRMNFYNEYSLNTNIPWYLIGAIDQYERNTKNYKDYCSKDEEIISICIDPKLWSGYNNPIEDDKSLYTINIFNGIGVDGDNDGYADRFNPHDRLSAILNYILDYGNTEEDIKEALLNYYNTEKGVQIIFEIAKLFNHFNTIELNERVFPIPKYYSADITNNYGTGRSYGGYRSHEGVDIFSHYGTPIVSTAYGVIEIIGWNNYGGYRIGIRDMFNTYEYYAHLNKFVSGLKVGDIVKPGQIIGYVGSTGYGKEGTSGKFPPHLHFGFYKFDGKKEWSFNPYRYLKKWPRISIKR